MRPWQVYSGGTWTDVTGASASFSPEALGTAIPNIYVTNGWIYRYCWWQTV
ncbi:MAG: hypothetical protein IPH74_03545 [Bacteroidetes bacterium]|nr:hypothetical protein [Bacteroidota bacterium]